MNARLLLLAFFSPIFGIAQTMGSFIDARDGHEYKTVRLGDQTWMAENLAWDAGEGTYLYDWRCVTMEKEGRKYTWFAAMQGQEGEGVRGACPENWRLPTKDDWLTLVQYLGGPSIAGKELKEGGDSRMEMKIPGRRFSDGKFRVARSEVHYWSSTSTGLDVAWCLIVFKVLDQSMGYEYDKEYVKSIRCIQED